MTAKEILMKHYNVEEGFTTYEEECFIAAMREYAKERCEEQRIFCAAAYSRFPSDLPFPIYKILNSQEPIFD